ncbi:MAG: simple sugar transport system permease protein [Kosmotogales bacterium]|nr:simple sugar transport system permease protein [Kosmotogales bacterium]
MKRQTGITDIFKNNEFVLIVAILIIGTIFTILKPNFFSINNLYGILVSNSYLAIMAMGVLVVLISGGIDISFTATATVAQYVMATIIINNGGNMFLAFLIAGLVGLALGSINAILVYTLKVPSIIVTISTLNAFYGLLIFITGGKWLYGFPMWFMDKNLVSFQRADGSLFGLSMPITLLVAAVIVTWIILRFTTLGRKVYALGGNPEAARRIGINIFKTQLFVYGFMGLMAGLASVIQANIMLTVAPNALIGRELEVLAAVVLGGASLAGGTGTVPGTLLGFFLIAIVQNGLTMLGISAYWHKIFIGMVIIVSVSITAYQRKRNEEKGAVIDVR